MSDRSPHSRKPDGEGRQTSPAAVKTLLRHFRSQRPLRGGSLLITIFGDSIAPRGGTVSLGSLIRLALPFGLTERLVRTSVARLAKEGWLVARREGRLSEYRLSSTGEQRFAEATRRIYGQSPQSWDGQWTLLLLRPGTGGRQPELLEELRWLGFGQIRPGVLAHPGCTLDQAREWLRSLNGAAADATGTGLLLKSSSDGLEADRQLVAAGWDLAELTRRYRRFLDKFEPVNAQAGTWEDSAAFVVRTLLIHEYRKIHLQDPLLPPALLPADWVGAAASDLCRRLYSQVFAAAERYLTTNASSLSTPLPAPDRSVYSRFGGITRSA